jgi:hypothetical protein
MVSDPKAGPDYDTLSIMEARLEATIVDARVGNTGKIPAEVAEAVNAFPNELRILHKAGVLMRFYKDTGAALALFSKALDAHPHFHFTEIEIADVHAERGDKDEALRWYRQAIESEPDYPIGYIRAAKLERDLGRSSNGLLLLEQLFERSPEHVEGNVLRAEFLQYHGRRSEMPRAYEAAITAGCDDPMVHYHYLRVLTELGDYTKVQTHAEQLNPPIGSFLAFHKAVFGGHAKLAGLFRRADLVASAGKRESSAAWLTLEQLEIGIREAIRDPTPLSIIRLGDGEGRFLCSIGAWATPYFSELEAECTLSLIWQNWFGQPIETVSRSDLRSLVDRFKAALVGADVLGVNTAERLERDNLHRGYLGVLEIATDDVVANHPEVLLTDAFVHTGLHNRSSFYKSFLAGIDFIGVIGPHPGLARRLAQYHGIKSFDEYLIPGESRLPAAQQGRDRGPHFPDRFNEIMANLRIPRRGAVFLVAAGLLGKIYCDRIRGLGGIGIDVGSIVDAWMGFNTRPGPYNDTNKWILPEPLVQSE